MDCGGGGLTACRWLEKEHPGATVADVVAELCCSGCRGDAPVWIMGQAADLLADLAGPRVLLVTGEIWPKVIRNYDPFRVQQRQELW